MQVSGMSSLGVSHSSAIDALRYILKTDGVKGLYKGLWPNLREYLYRNLVVWEAYMLIRTLFLFLVKVAPSIATSFFTYEVVKEFLLS